MIADPEILVIGALHLDVVVDAPRFPQPDETMVGTSVSYRPGGKGANQARTAARMGSTTAMAGRIGTDQFGDRVLRSLADAEVDCRQVRQVAGESGMSVAIVEPDGNYGAVIVSGVNGSIDPAEIDIPPSLKALLLQCEVPPSVNSAAIARAPEACRVILNAAPYRPHEYADPTTIGRVDILVVNRIEAAQHFGLDEKRLDVEHAAAALASLGPAAVIVTLGSEGLFVHAQGTGIALPALRVDVVSTHGAGDAFVGALAAELVKTSDLRSAIEFAQAAAALTVATAPSERSRIDRKEVVHLIERRSGETVELDRGSSKHPSGFGV